MKPVDKFGRTLYPSAYRKLTKIGSQLEELDWKESKNKPNLFYKDFNGSIIFADMRGTDEVPIWESPFPLMYALNEGPEWKRRNGLVKAIEELTNVEVETRLSFYDSMEIDGLFGGPEEELPDGFCKMCETEITDGEREDGLFCSEHCEKAFAQLQEMRREEETQRIKCALCGTTLDIWSKNTIQHHISYDPETTITVCRSCHGKIHSKHENYPELAPKRPPDWKTNVRQEILDYDQKKLR